MLSTTDHHACRSQSGHGQLAMRYIKKDFRICVGFKLLTMSFFNAGLSKAEHIHACWCKSHCYFIKIPLGQGEQQLMILSRLLKKESVYLS